MALKVGEAAAVASSNTHCLLQRRSLGVGNEPTGPAAVSSVLAYKVLREETHLNRGGECLVELLIYFTNAMHRKVIRS